MNPPQDKKKLKEMIENTLACFVLVYKTKRGNYKVFYRHTREEKKEIKSIIVGKLLK